MADVKNIGRQKGTFVKSGNGWIYKLPIGESEKGYTKLKICANKL